MQGRSVGAIEDDEAHAIEAGETAGRGNPEIANGCLLDRLNAIARQTIFRAPDSVAVLARNQLGRGQGERVTQDGADGTARFHFAFFIAARASPEMFLSALCEA